GWIARLSDDTPGNYPAKKWLSHRVTGCGSPPLPQGILFSHIGRENAFLAEVWEQSRDAEE
ncbi:MAG TPA: hypothetical protein PKJ03_09110, partial [Methanoregulaceae archaeon]|nr:hypothetical protein [Methanoregulaceae archaeon]